MKAKNKIQFEHLQNKRKTQREREQDRHYNSQMYPTFGKTSKNTEPIFNKL